MILVEQETAVKLYLDPAAADYDGLRRVADSFAADIELVTGTRPEIVTEPGQLGSTAIVIGTIGSSGLIDEWAAAGKLDVPAISGKRECYSIQRIGHPCDGVEQALVIAGSDKRGTIYGVYAVSELMGVSPWVYFADVMPERRALLDLPDHKLNVISKEPSVKYRGIFLNDDWPSLGSWVTGAFGDFNEAFYEKVFELILRLKGNYLWPAMWSAEFSVNGKRHPLANAELAREYGIIIGTSHHEPLFRAGSEWQKVYKDYGTSNLWDFARNREAITAFWEDGIKRNKEYPNLITLGMRGESDSELEGSDHYNIELLKDIILTQKELLKCYGLEQAPQVLAVYKEVEKYWYGTAEVAGLKDWEVLNDVTILLSDDNFGNLRKIPSGLEQQRSAGWGMYYHLDYHGGPHSYEWVNTTPLEKVWEQMSMAYDYGIRDVWIVNVGDLKPMELPISYFLDLAYDFGAWGTGAPNKTAEYTEQWVRQQFGHAADEAAVSGIAGVLADYTRMNGRRKPEIIRPETFSPVHYNEAQQVLKQAGKLVETAEYYRSRIPEQLQAAYFQLVYFPAAASANVLQMQVYTRLSKLYAERGSVLANTYAELTAAAIERDKQLEQAYNNDLSGGKWRGMMSSAHVGYVNWDAAGWSYPQAASVIPVKGPLMIVDVQGTEQGYTSGTAALPAFTNLHKESYSVTVSSGGDTGFAYEAAGSADWIRLERSGGWTDTGESITVSVDWEKVQGSCSGNIVISGAGGTVTVCAEVDWSSLSELPPVTFIEAHNVVSIEAEHTLNHCAADGVEWTTISHYGRTLSSVKMYPDTVSFSEPEQAPYLEYRLLIKRDGEYSLTAYIAPTNHLSPVSGLKYAAGFDGGEPIVADALPPGYEGGNHSNEPWCRAVMNNIHVSSTSHTLTKGVHTLRFYGLDAGLVLQKLVLSAGPLPYSYLGPEESYLTSAELTEDSP
ncbi:glycosyl hydrolase 115 family protein [Paenibacillus sp. FSL R7-0331]|uniref:glycosyl hydrolase 115 family protein n=1 Tax=Paenibacillus sp. FSL R7-0331 TaxID=1536773 RepID=UPI0005A99B94|nr:glycosyl hydrolase 115 family protein [Paenibacillus sp. FSL R7-0331]